MLPHARVIHLRRDPIDTCLSCYFQQFSPIMTYAMDLTDLAAYYRQHQRLAAHWHKVLPSESLLDVPYAELVAEPEKWTRRILEFLGLPWDERCLRFLQDRTGRDHRQRLAGAAEDLSDLGAALAQLRELHRPAADTQRPGAVSPARDATRWPRRGVGRGRGRLASRDSRGDRAPGAALRYSERRRPAAGPADGTAP